MTVLGRSVRHNYIVHIYRNYKNSISLFILVDSNLNFIQDRSRTKLAPWSQHTTSTPNYHFHSSTSIQTLCLLYNEFSSNFPLSLSQASQLHHTPCDVISNQTMSHQCEPVHTTSSDIVQGSSPGSPSRTCGRPGPASRAVGLV